MNEKSLQALFLCGAVMKKIIVKKIVDIFTDSEYIVN